MSIVCKTINTTGKHLYGVTVEAFYERDYHISVLSDYRTQAYPIRESVSRSECKQAVSHGPTVAST